MANLPPALLQLIQKFAEHADHYKSLGYNETLCRIDLINPLLTLLGWDVENKKGYADAYREVYHEDAVKVGSATKAPDYSFRIGGQRKFFLEAKKPGRDLKNEPEPAYQLRRYAWSAKLPLSVLTDFEEFAVYDGRVEPSLNDKASTARIFYCRYDQLADPHKDYPTNWDWIVSIFSPEAIQKGSFDKYAQTVKGKRGTAEVDVAFLREIESWRDTLARAFAKENTLSQRDLNFAVQRTIDRIIFLRICEDRGIEPYGQLAALSNGQAVYARLCELFRRGDEKYNSGIFHFHKEKDRHEAHDELTPTLVLDDKPLKEILKNLYYPKSPYEFSVLSADILGQVYEQFLGKVIRLTSDHRAVVEEKPDVRKAGGVYYTPTYIVDYIVQNTVGKLLEGKSPKEAAKLRILDPACGSGSFLIGAYQHLMNWHAAWYTANDPQKFATGKNPAVYSGKGGAWRLTINERKRILLNNIYGVDIDPQAVETTKLSLLLKVLEGESQESLDNQMKLFRERALPDLGDNIKCGNSLIGPDFYDNAQMMMLGEEEKLRINVFEWKREFAAILDAPSSSTSRKADSTRRGFDAVIGNPPYVLLQILEQPATFQYLGRRFEAARYKIDTYHLFFEIAIELTAPGGLYAYITPNTFVRNQHALALRELILQASVIRTLRLLNYPVFAAASVDTAILIAQRRNSHTESGEVEVVVSGAPGNNLSFSVPQSKWQQHPRRELLISTSGDTGDTLASIEKSSFPLREIATAYFGIQTYDRTVYVDAKSKGRAWLPVIDGINIGRYSLSPPVEFVDFESSAIKSGGNPMVYARERIGVRQIGKTPIATLLPQGLLTLNTIYNIYITATTPYQLKFLLAIVASRANRLYWTEKFFDQKKTFPKIKKPDLLSIRIPLIDFTASSGARFHDQVVSLVDQMLALHKSLAAAKTPHGQDSTRRQIDAVDGQLDRLVYKLYRLTDAEIAIVEAGTASS